MCLDVPESQKLAALEIVLIFHEYALLAQRNPMRHPVGQRFGLARSGKQEFELPQSCSLFIKDEEGLFSECSLSDDAVIKLTALESPDRRIKGEFHRLIGQKSFVSKRTA